MIDLEKQQKTLQRLQKFKKNLKQQALQGIQIDKNDLADILSAIKRHKRLLKQIQFTFYLPLVSYEEVKSKNPFFLLTIHKQFSRKELFQQLSNKQLTPNAR